MMLFCNQLAPGPPILGPLQENRAIGEDPRDVYLLSCLKIPNGLY